MSLVLPNIIVVHKPIRMTQNHKLAPNFNVVENIDYPHYNHQPKALKKEIEANSKKLHN
jgi:ABC-type lipoprotein export system ATPase subunit